MRRPVALALAALATWELLTASSCATTGGPEPNMTTITVHDQVPVSCVPADFPPAPASPAPTDTDLKAAKDGAARYQLLAEFWNLWAPRLKLDEATVASCQRAAPAPHP